MFKRIRPKSIANSISNKAKVSNWMGEHSKGIATGTAITLGVTTAIFEKNFKLPLSLASTYFGYKVKRPIEVLANKGISRQVGKCIARPRLAKQIELAQKNEFLRFLFNAAGKVSTKQEKEAFTKFLNLGATSTDWITSKEYSQKPTENFSQKSQKVSFWIQKPTQSSRHCLEKCTNQLWQK